MNAHALIKQDPWAYICSEYMVWSLRIVSYSINFHIFHAVRGGLVPRPLSPLLYDLAIFVYGILCLYVLEVFYRRVHNPEYKGLQLTEEGHAYRVSGERIIFSCATFCALTFFLGFAVGMLTKGVNGPVLALGVFGGVTASFLVLFGTVMMVAKGRETRRRSRPLCVIGMILQVFPVGFVLYTATLYLRSLF